MLKPIPVLLFLLFSLQLVHAQKEAAVWYFGYNAGVDFNSGVPVPLADSQMYTREGCATISDPNGNLMFYTDGITVWNRNHGIMPNGTGLKGHTSSTQSAIIVPKSDEPHIFYIFTVDDVGEPDGLQYSVVDMNLDGGLGDITTEKNILLYTPVSEKVTAVAHANGTGVWVVTKGWNTNAYFSFLVNASGVHPTPVVSHIGHAATGAGAANQETQGYLKASPDGRFLALGMMGQGKAEICRFDAATGQVSDWISLQDVLDDFWYYREPYGIEFSPNSRVLYVSVKAGILQFDLSTYDQASIQASMTMVSPFNSLPPFLGALQTGIDGKIYVVRTFRSYLNVINDPNVVGMGCNYEEQVIDLGTDRLGVSGLPPFLTSYFDFGIQAENFCLGDATSFSIDTTDPIVSIDWDFGDGATSSQETPDHTYALAGTYTVTVTLQTLTENLSKTKEITIYPVPVAHKPTDIEVCSIAPDHLVDLTGKNDEILGTQSVTEFQLSYHASLAEAENNTDPLPHAYTTTLGEETVYARIQHVQNPECFDTTDFKLVVHQAPIVNTQDDWTVCDLDMDGFYTFDLSEKVTSILEGNDASTYSVDFYPSQTDLDNDTNALPTAYTNTLARETLFWKIRNDAYPDCYGEGSFFIEVTAGVTAHAPSPITVCDDDNDGFVSLDLTQKEHEILGTQSPTSIQMSYHRSLVDAENGTAALANWYSNTTPYTEIIYVRVENATDASCYATTLLDLRISDTPTAQSVTDWRVCDADGDGRQQFDLQTKATEILGGASSSDFTLRFYESQADADADTHAVSGLFSNTANPQRIFYRVAHVNNPQCYLTDQFWLYVDAQPVAHEPDPFNVCATTTDGTYLFDLSAKDSEVLNGQSTDTFTVSYFATETAARSRSNPLPKTAYVNRAPEETLYARIQNMEHAECYAITSLDIRVYPVPQPDLQAQYVICPDSPELIIDGGDFEAWSWRDENGAEMGTMRSMAITGLGRYTLTVARTENGTRCEHTVPFEVVSSGAPEDFSTEIGDFSDRVPLTLTVIGSGTFEYSLDGETFQDSNRFEVFPGIHTIYVRDTLLCRTLQKEMVVLGYQKFFTPNNDAVNERWNVIGAEPYPDAELFIFDRYGRLLRQLDPHGPGWDGTCNGLQMPSSDYWFRFLYGDGQEFSGHFSLKR